MIWILSFVTASQLPEALLIFFSICYIYSDWLNSYSVSKFIDSSLCHIHYAIEPFQWVCKNLSYFPVRWFPFGSFSYLAFWGWDFLYFHLFSRLSNCLLKHFYDGDFEILLRWFQHVSHLSVDICWLFFLIHDVIFPHFCCDKWFFSLYPGHSDYYVKS